jgi:pilus assembly protein FimV
MKRLIVSGAVLLGFFSSIVTACGSRSSDTDYLPDGLAGAGNVAGNAGSPPATAGNAAVAGSPAAGAPGAGAGGLSNAAGAAGSPRGGASSAGFSGFIGIAGSPSVAGSGGVSGGGHAGFGAGGTSTGGSPGVAGSPGTAGSSGAAGSGGGNNAACPDTAPSGMCTTAALQCNYTGRSCSCRALGPNMIWRCTGSGTACPSAEPAAATACMGNLQCPYPDGNQCNCGASGVWNCFTAGCPASKPTPSGSCGSVFGQCTYGTGAGSSCVCVQGGWFCN